MKILFAFLLTLAFYHVTAQPGTLDSTFGSGGVVVTTIGTNLSNIKTAMAIQGDNKIIVAGSAVVNNAFNFTLIRYLPDGALDPSFDTDGIVNTLIDARSIARAIAIQPDGKIIVGGSAGTVNKDNFALARYLENGSPDLSFGTNGVVVTSISTSQDDIRAIALQPDGKIVAVGYSGSGAVLARYHRNGALDLSFDGDGKLLLANGSVPTSVAIQPDGKILAFGSGVSGLARYNSNGSVDSTFDGDGKVATGGAAMLLQNDGKIVTTNVNDVRLTRYNSDGSIDPSFFDRGRTLTNIPSTTTAANLIQNSDGKIIAVSTGRNDDGSNLRFLVLRYQPNGTLDASFGTNGFTMIKVGTSNNYAFGVAVTTSRIYVGGTSGDAFATAAFKNDVLSQSCVNDITPPTLNTKNVTLTLDSTGQIALQPSVFIQSLTDNCTSASSEFNLTVTPSTLSCINLLSGSATIVTVTARDARGNLASTTANIILQDTLGACRTINNKLWTWVKGDSISATAVYGTLGLPADDNKPGPRKSSVSWTDTSGNFWLFGGVNNNVRYNDLWKFSPESKQWTWVKGSQSGDRQGVYGTQGQPAPANTPGARQGGTTWVDNNGDLWLFGGYGYSISSSPEFLSDIWKYNISTNQWTWMKGRVNTQYGTLGLPAESNNPSPRRHSLSWTDANGNLWLFGGFGSGVDNFLSGQLSDLWKYNISTNQWTWVNGDDNANKAAVYGTRGIPAAGNKPGGRCLGATWKDGSGDLWFFGGLGYVANVSIASFNDLWKYNISSNEWTWVGGDNTPNNPGLYGIRGVASPSNKPGGRDSYTGWQDAAGNFWIFGGWGRAAAASTGRYLNDLWKYDIISNEWTWYKGDQFTDVRSVYGTKGIPSATNKPSSRYESNGWKDKAGNLWLFGGEGLETTTLKRLNDLWKFGTALNFSGKVFLQGAFNSSSATMRTTLNTSGILKAQALSQPYQTAPFSYAGTEKVDPDFFAAHPDIVDWVLIELRDQVTPSVVVARRAAFVNANGTILETDGNSTQVIFEGVPTGNYFVVIRHRNHLAIRSSTAIDFTAGNGNYDFTTAASKAYQSLSYTSTVSLGAAWAMRGGNANANLNVKFNGPDNDQNQILNNKLLGSLGDIFNNMYAPEDVNMDGTIKWNGPGNDQNFLLNLVLSGLLGTIFNQQL